MARATNKLTGPEVKAATFEKYGKRTKLADGNGLYLDIQPAGRYWRLKYRYAGKEKLLALGVYPETTLKQARAYRDEARQMLANDTDPAAYRRLSENQRREAAANTFRAVALEWLEKVHHKSVGATTYQKNARRLEMHVYPKLGTRPLSDIEPPDVLDVLRTIESKGHADNAHRLKTIIGQVFRYGVSTGRTKRDVTADLRGLLSAPDVRHHPAVITPDEIAHLLQELHAYWGNPTVCAALKIAPYVFLRPGNLRQMRWAEIDWEGPTWTTETTKNGEPLVVPLASQVVTILREMEALNGRSEWVFTSGHGKGRPMSENAMTAALNRMGFKGIMTGHGFRAMAKTVLTERLSFRTEIIEMQMAHRVRDVHGRAYNRTTWLPERREMMQQWADYLDNLRTGGNVVAIGQTASK
ncbi:MULTISPECIES: integrase arm-type DNA-binding domain-containing protein [unclassified Marinobacter]|jgi:integrase|uniref:tyrosine-type recombinase/integrase n=1 Tax=unclassified Marinobacter TaxID=83889 RepID=UPI00200BA66A|nr:MULTISPECIES: integrase arm-type DNA-binding domain-containing protein [unclassified Marinobacter]MCL1483654.1 integrase arm-type DNA-binding domain-containing protein [Marinobacter sp.]UQG56698.1 integrase arm-type DNA-binding domain-containing protein [Marinobacter sp. M4C]UQG65502.1 integrase arm-type DNA-binding domain-containing protein [Marinobacter sp. M2C]UQG69782.1 integrase arm-type DNA-binding domain-containing protein [Marinobacter sp. M1C]